jgi:hypothetical protein
MPRTYTKGVKKLRPGAKAGAPCEGVGCVVVESSSWSAAGFCAGCRRKAPAPSPPLTDLTNMNGKRPRLEESGTTGIFASDYVAQLPTLAEEVGLEAEEVASEAALQAELAAVPTAAEQEAPEAALEAAPEAHLAVAPAASPTAAPIAAPTSAAIAAPAATPTRARGGLARRCLCVPSPVPRPFCGRHRNGV